MCIRDSIITAETKARMKQALTDIQEGTFAKNWILENQAGRPRYNALKRQGQEHQVEEVGAELRKMMPFIKPTIKAVSYTHLDVYKRQVQSFLKNSKEIIKFLTKLLDSWLSGKVNKEIGC